MSYSRQNRFPPQDKFPVYVIYKQFVINNSRIGFDLIVADFV